MNERKKRKNKINMKATPIILSLFLFGVAGFLIYKQSQAQQIHYTPPSSSSSSTPPPSSSSSEDVDPGEELEAELAAMATSSKHVSQAAWSNWASSEPTGPPGSLQCLRVTKDGLWHDDPCDEKRPGLCFNTKKGIFTLTTQKYSGNRTEEMEDDCAQQGHGIHFWRPLSPIEAEEAVRLGTDAWAKIGGTGTSVHLHDKIPISYKKKR